MVLQGTLNSALGAGWLVGGCLLGADYRHADRVVGLLPLDRQGQLGEAACRHRGIRGWEEFWE